MERDAEDSRGLYIIQRSFWDRTAVTFRVRMVMESYGIYSQPRSHVNDIFEI